MKVMAVKKGFFGKLREPGDEFEVPDKTKLASWFVEAKKTVSAPIEKAKPTPAKA